MMKMERPQQPEWLRENYKKWGKTFKRKLENPKKSNTFVWATYRKEKINKKLLVILRNSTQKHCAFCDDKIKKGTIEHFRPSSTFPLLSYVWINLFPSCSECQEKNNAFHKNLLKPDFSDYAFRKFFLFNPFTGKIDINPKASDFEKIRAETTRTIYNLNSDELIEARLDAFDNYQNVTNEKRPFRFIFTQ
jgi:uncharacterized protein (TIGR02646 family)